MTDYLCTETPDRLITESGDNIILNQSTPSGGGIVIADLSKAFAFMVGWTVGNRRMKTNGTS